MTGNTVKSTIQGLSGLGQAPGDNRLLGVPVRVILDRQRLALLPRQDPGTGRWFSPSGQLIAPVGPMPLTPAALEVKRDWGWDSGNLEVMSAVRTSPTQAELADLGLADAFFGAPLPAPVYDSGRAMTVRIEECRASAQRYGVTPAADPIAQACNAAFPGYTNPFFYTMRPELPGPPRDRGSSWEIARDAPWGRARRDMMNALAAEPEINAYPWPSPPHLVARFWSKYGWRGLRNFVLSHERPIDRMAVRTAITMSLLKDWDAIVGDIEDYLKKKERKQRRRGIVKAIAGIALGAVFAIFAPAIISNVVQLGISAMDAANKIKAAVGVAKVARQFEKSDAAFAAELDRVATELDAQAAANEKAAPPTQAEIEALAEEEGAYEVRVEGKPVGVASTPEEASALALEKSSSGDRIQVYYHGKSQGLFLRVAEGVVAVAPEKEPEILAASPSELRAQTAAVRTERAFPWGVVVPAAAAFLLLS